MSHSLTAPVEKSCTQVSGFKPFSLTLGIIIGLAVFVLLPESLALDARIVAAIAMLMATWWMTEAIPIPATSLLPLVLFPFFDIASIGTTASPYAHSIVFLVLGGVLLGLAAQRWNLHRRFALLTVLTVGTKPAQIVFGLMFASWFITMWVSNTATAVIMVPIGGSIIALVKSLGNGDDTPKFSAAVLLGIAYSITIGSMATLVGQPPMALMRAYMEDSHGLTIGFGHWMLMGVPFSFTMLILAWVVLSKVVFRSEVGDIQGGRELIESELKAMGRLSPEERRVLNIFAGAVFFWVFVPLIAKVAAVNAALPWLSNINDTSVAILAAILLFVIPASKGRGMLMEWSATRDVPWGVLLLFGGGLTLSAQFTATGLSAWVGESVSGLAGLPPILVLAFTAIVIILLTELTSNTATAAAFFPIMGAIAGGLNIDPFLMTIVVTFAVSCAFMLPVATPSNAVAFATGDLPIQSMIRAGIWLNIIGLSVILIALYTIVPLVFGVSF
ncbi:sodium-dependent dicarboxylate transporter 2/3/5 [Oceanisphaera litoralis]|uniref:SLC13 family permease n=1 Tax=Oceanisphaera litoralis TaxID=225144 RepID=UPI0019574D22|nr:DASS family sodium-coupled anion symporter [Oceanisphaera litoralis]MBM7455867.1 sodium-dependent dicarboxylate transporter 2/3/5 [Oceanisphaera litoralis]